MSSVTFLGDGPSQISCLCLGALAIGMMGCSAPKTSTPLTTSSPLAVEETTAPAPTTVPNQPSVVAENVAQASEIPEPFQGEWNTDTNQCGSLSNDARLKISAKRIQFHESEGAIQEIKTEGPDTLTVSVELSGEGTTWVSAFKYQLSEDRKALTQLADGSSLVRYRCP